MKTLQQRLCHHNFKIVKEDCVPDAETLTIHIKRTYECENCGLIERENEDLPIDPITFPIIPTLNENEIQCAACGFIGDIGKFKNSSVHNKFKICPQCGTVRFLCEENMSFCK